MVTKVFVIVTNQFLQCRQPTCKVSSKSPQYFWVIFWTNRQTDKRRAKYNLLAEVKSHILPCSVCAVRQSLFQQSLRLRFSSTHLHQMAIKLGLVALLKLPNTNRSSTPKAYVHVNCTMCHRDWKMAIQYPKTPVKLPSIFRKRFRVPGFGTGSGTVEPVPWNRFLRQITNLLIMHING